jgi:hypothetical protein
MREGIDTCVRGKMIWKKGRRVNMVQQCVYMYENAKIIPAEAISRMGGGMKESSRGMSSNILYVIHCKNFCKCCNVPTPNITIKK